MLFRPKFCANCGEKIERSEWRLWTSRRFCELCATEFQLQEYLPRIVVGLAVATLILGIGNYFGSGTNRNEPLIAKQRTVEKPVAQVAIPVNNSVAANSNVSPVAQESKAFAAIPQTKPLAIEKTVSTEPVYFCGAQTKKGTACSRRVKGNTRCFQHTGMPAMFPADKLKVS